MTCPKCSSSGHYNEIMGKGYYYCRTCKDEIHLEQPKAEATPGIFAFNNGLTSGRQVPLPNPSGRNHIWTFLGGGTSSVCQKCNMDDNTFYRLLAKSHVMPDCDPSATYKTGIVHTLPSGIAGPASSSTKALDFLKDLYLDKLTKGIP